MPIKSATGKSSKITTPAEGTIKRVSPAAPGLVSTRSKLANSKSESVNRTESALPTEIVSVVDFNRIYEESSRLTGYGQYFEALNSIHSITTEDVKYTVDKAIQNDNSGLWKSLKDKVDASTADADDFVEDLANLLNKIERAEISLDVNRSGDSELQTAAIDYLAPKLKKYEQPAEKRNFETRDFFALASLWGGDQSLQSILTDLRNSITHEDHPEYKSQIIEALSQKSLNDLNTGERSAHWASLDSVATSASDRMVAFATVLSQVISLSVGIERVRSDSIATRISFDPENLGSIFEGTKRGDKVPFVGKLSSKVGPGILALSLLQFNSKSGKTAVPTVLHDPADESFVSGPASMVRDALASGDYSFSDLSNYCAQFESSRSDIERYTEILVGKCDPANDLTPIEVLRTSVKYFIKALELAGSSDQAQYELMVLKKAASRSQLKQQVLRSAGRTKYFQLISNVSSSPGSSESGGKTSLSTSKTSKGEFIKDDAESTTTQVEDKSHKAPVRIVARLASDSPTSTDMANSMYEMIHDSALDDTPSKQDAIAKLKKLNESLASFEKQLAAARFDTGDVEKQAILKYLEDKVASIKSHIIEWQSKLATAPKFDKKDTIKKYLHDMTLTPTGTVISSMVDAYNEILNSAVSKLPEGRKMTNIDGTTKFGNLDEFGLLSLIVEIFSILSDNLDATVNRDKQGNLFVRGLESSAIRSMKLDLMMIIPDSETLKKNLFTDAPTASTAMLELYDDAQRYQNRQAFLAAFSSVLTKSKNDLVDGVKDLLSTPSRRSRLDNEPGRKLMSTITSQQVIYRRTLVDKYRPDPSNGYLPACSIYSENDDLALKKLLASPSFSSKKSENTRIAFVAVPIGTISESVRYVNEDLGEVNYSGFLELTVRKKDEEFDDIIFKNVSYILDQNLFVLPGSILPISTTKRQVSSDAALEIAKQCRFRLYGKDGSEDLDYQSLRNHSRYSKINSQKKDEIAKNAVLSYLLELYLYKVSGLIFDETVSLELNDTVSPAGINALISTSNLKLPDLKLPTPLQISSLLSNGEMDFSFNDGVLTTGDKELISSLTDSYLMKNENPIDRLVPTPTFDRIFAVSFDPDDFTIDKSQTAKIYGKVGSSILKSLQQAGLLIENNGSLRIIPRDPQSGGFAISSFTCQFAPHTLNSNGESIFKIFQSRKEKKAVKVGSTPKLKGTQSSTKTFTFSKIKR